MLGWYFLMGALALIAAVLLLGFVGCAPFSGTASGMAEDYPTTIEKTKDLVAYWRLGDKASAVPTGDTKDALGKYNGNRHQYPGPLPADNVQHSPATNGILLYGQTPGLLELSPSSPCLDLDGGWIQVPFDNALNPPQFTLEAWVSPDPLMPKGFFHCLVQSAGPGLSLLQQKTGWGLFLGPDDPNKTPPDDYFWQVWMGDGTQLKRMAIANGTDCPTLLRLTYLALTFDGANLQLWLYYPDNQQLLDIKHLRGAQNPKVTTFKRNDTSPDGQGLLFIGAGSCLFPGGVSSFLPLYPFKGKIQEVALYKRDLSAPNNAGVQATLAAHEMAGGNL